MKPMSILAISLFFSASALAADPTPATAPAKKEPTAQQQRMSDCNKKAEGKKGDDRKTYMSACLKGEEPAPASNAKTAQQQKMVDCNKQAEGKKGDERKKFMSECLKAK